MRTVLSTESASALSQLAVKGRAAGLNLGPAQEFESQLIGSLLNSVEKSFASVPGGELAGGDNYNYLGNSALASVLTTGKGFGIASFILKHLDAPMATPPNRDSGAVSISPSLPTTSGEPAAEDTSASTGKLKFPNFAVDK